MTSSTVPQRLRALWMLCAWAPIGVLVVLGGAYLLGGLNVTVSDKPYALISRQLPTGMHAHGLLMLIAGVTLLVWLAPTLAGPVQPRAHWEGAVRIGAGYLWVIVAALAGAPLAGGRTSLTGVILWSLPALMLTFAGFIRPPRPDEYRPADDRPAESWHGEGP